VPLSNGEMLPIVRMAKQIKPEFRERPAKLRRTLQKPKGVAAVRQSFPRTAFTRAFAIPKVVWLVRVRRATPVPTNHFFLFIGANL
jgi:hypothetical protein